MRVFYTASYTGKEKYQNYYDMVLRAIEATGVDVVSPEKGNYLDVLTAETRKRYQSDSKRLHYEAIRKGILSCDAVIIEISNEDFQLGHEATLAIQNKKHVLCLSIHEDFGEKIKSRYFLGAKYNQFNIEETIEDFILMIGTETKSERFNMFLRPRQANYLKSKSEEEGMSMSDYVRLLIDRDRHDS